jgi:hypothetical protein
VELGKHREQDSCIGMAWDYMQPTRHCMQRVCMGR